jgi:hypothetical protein
MPDIKPLLTSKLAVYTTVHPGVEKYFGDWFQSLQAQSDGGFDLWVGVDSLDTASLEKIVGETIPARWVHAERGDKPAQIRQRAIEAMVSEYEAVVFVDSDDILLPARIESARRALAESDVNGCAMRIVDGDGRDLGVTFAMPEAIDIETTFVRGNVLGLSNSAYRSELLRNCLPIPDTCILVDWFLSTCAWILGAKINFDPVCRMAYRQHSENTARILPPFTGGQILKSTGLVVSHYDLMLEKRGNIMEAGQRRLMEETLRYTISFFDSIRCSAQILERYLDALNALPPAPRWWSCVAHPGLEPLWKN